MTDVKIAKIEDEAEIIRMVRRFHSQSPYSTLPFDEGYVSSLIRNTLGQPISKAAIFLAMEDKPVGLLVAVSNPSIFNGKPNASELLFWIDEDHRRKGFAQELKNVYEYWATEIAKAQVAAMSSLEDDSAKVMHRYYRRQGYTLGEHQYFRKL